MNKRIFVTLFFSIFAAVTGVGIVVPLLPVYAHELGASGFYVGMIFGSFSISRTVLVPYFGKLSDVRGRKPFVSAGLLLYALLSFAFMMAENVFALIGIRFAQGIASAMILPVAQAYVGEITPEGKEGFVMGLFNISMYSSLSLGPLLGGSVKDRLGIDAAFAIMGVLAFVAFLLTAFLLPPTKEEPRRLRHEKPMSYANLLKRAEVLGIVVFRLAYTICIGVIWTFLPIFASTEFHLSSSSIGVLIMLGVFMGGVLQAPMGFLADRYSKRRMAALGGFVVAGAVVYLIYASGFWGLFLANCLFGIGGGIAAPPIMALGVIEGSRTGSMGAVMALLTMGHSLGMMIGSILGGIVMDLLSLRVAYMGGAAMMVAGVAFFLLCTGRRRAPKEAGASGGAG
ncbi:MFS transporter [Thermodesulfobacteriota bacterium]